jgi:hypothetical protein
VLGASPHGAFTLVLLTVDVDARVAQISSLLHQAAETHHVVFAISDGDDQDWASWYADWLVNLSSLPDVLGRRPVRSELTYLLVSLDKEYTRDRPADRWEDFYAARLHEHFALSA